MKLTIEEHSRLKGPLAQMTKKTLASLNKVLKQKIAPHNKTFTMGDFVKQPFFVLVEDDPEMADGVLYVSDWVKKAYYCSKRDITVATKP